MADHEPDHPKQPPSAQGDPTVTRAESSDTACVPKQIGQYHIKRALASGGMGTVYEAVQEHPRRTVAVKVMKQGITSKSALRRFEYESQVLARLRHPAIAQVYEAGTHEGDTGLVPFFAMEYVPNAKRITTYAEQKKLDNRGKLKLFAEVCDAVHHGHQKGIIHRDLKPANILVDSHGQPKVIDFGVARGTDSDMAMATLQTDIGQLIGTLQYMSPEQCEGDPHDIDTRSDVYALGVVLYELLSGQLPYDVSKTQLGESTRIIREQLPARLRRRTFGSGTRSGTTVSTAGTPRGTVSTRVSSVDADLETIVFRALEKDRDRRYQSAIELKQDVERYLAGEAIVARPASIVYQLKIFARRNKALFGAMSSAFAVLIVGMIVSTSLYLRAEDARRETAAERDRAAAAERRATRVSDFLQEMIGYADPHAAKRPNFTMRQALDEAARKIGTSLRDEPQIEAEVRMSIAKAYMSLGEPDLAEPHYREALAIRTELFGETHETVATSITGLAWFYHDKADYAEAERLDRQALDMRRAVHGPRHLDVADSLISLGDIARHQGDLETAEAMVREALDMATDLGGEDHKVALHATKILALVYDNQGRYDESETLFEQRLEILRRELGPEHLGTLETMGSLADVYQHQRRYGESETLYEQTLEILKRVWGPEHPDTLRTLLNLAGVYKSQAHYDEAATLYERTLEIYERVLGSEHPDTLAGMHDLAGTYLHQARYAEAATLAEQRLEIFKRVRGPEHPDTLEAMGRLAVAYQSQGRYAEAETLFEQTLEILRRVEGLEHPGTLVCLHHLAEMLHIGGKSEEAEPLAREAVELYARAGISDWESAHADQVLLTILRARGKLDEAVALYKDRLEIQTRELGEEHPTRLMTLHHFADMLHTAGKSEEAEPLAREAVDLYARAGIRDGESAHAEEVLLAILLARGKLDEVAALYKDMLEIQRREIGEEHPTRLMTLHHLADVLHAAGKSEEAEPLAREAVDLYARAGLSDSESRHADWVLATILLARGKLDEARPLMAVTLERQRRAADEADADASALNEYAWALLTIEPADLRDPAAALPMAQKAVEKSRGEDPAILDTLAKAWFDTGDPAKAVETQQKAVSLLPPGDSPLRKELDTNLATYRAATTQPAAEQPPNDQEP